MALEIDRFVFVDTRGESGRIGHHNRANSRKACHMGTAGHPKAYTRNAGPPLSGQMEDSGAKEPWGAKMLSVVRETSV